MISIQTLPFSSLTATQLYKILQLREVVFVLEQDCLYQDIDNIDQQAWHTFAQDGETIIAYARTFWKDKEQRVAQIGRVVTHPHYRRQQKATMIMQAALQIAATEMKAEQVYLEAQTYAIPLYEQLGFSITSDEFLEDGIPHVQMRRPL